MYNPDFMRAAIALATDNISSNAWWPFGCVIIKDGTIVGKGNNRVTSTNDPTAHAEMVAIRDACKTLNSFQLDGCDIYTSCEPCPMCLGALYRARPAKIYYANTRADAAAIGFDDNMMYEELTLPHADKKIPLEQILRSEALESFQLWQEKQDKTLY
jgi:guanine deaminase